MYYYHCKRWLHLYNWWKSLTHFLRNGIFHEVKISERCVANLAWFLWLQIRSLSASRYWSLPALCSRNVQRPNPSPAEQNRTEHFLWPSSSLSSSQHTQWMLVCCLFIYVHSRLWHPHLSPCISSGRSPRDFFWISWRAQWLHSSCLTSHCWRPLQNQVWQCWCSSFPLVILISLWVQEPETSGTKALLPLMQLIIKQIGFNAATSQEKGTGCGEGEWLMSSDTQAQLLQATNLCSSLLLFVKTREKNVLE